MIDHAKVRREAWELHKQGAAHVRTLAAEVLRRPDVATLLAYLTPRQERIVRGRLLEGKSSRELASWFEVSTGRIQQLEVSGLVLLVIYGRQYRDIFA